MSPYFVSHRHPRIRLAVRLLRAFGYAASAVGGGVIIFVGDPPFGTFYVTMGIFCVVGGALTSSSMLTGRWVEEFLGLPLLSSAMLCLAAITARDVFPISVWVGLPSVAILTSFGLLLFARWIDVYALALSASRLGRKRKNRE